MAPPSELSLPQLCLAVSAKELVSRVSKRGEQHAEERAGEEGTETETSNGDGAELAAKEGRLFREREPLSFFAVDCRPKEQVNELLVG